MAKDFTTSYFAITKKEKQADGTLYVYGKATDDSIDSDQQICDSAWLSKAMPDWFKSGGNIREQHSNIAAGKAKEYEEKADGHYIGVLVVDPTSVLKCENEVFGGFSIGIRSPRVIRDEKAVNGRIIDGTIVEVSLVDRPANPNARLVLAKSEGAEVIQVEELIENEVTEEIVVEEIVEIPVEESVAEPVQEIVEDVIPAEVVTEETSSEEIVVEDEAEKSAKAIIELAKTLSPEIKKFDQATYEIARNALASLIVSEATEMIEGDDERYSLNCLMESVNALLNWKNGEAWETEAEPLSDVTTVEMSDTPDEKISEISVSDIGSDAVTAIIDKAVKSAKESVLSEIEILKSASEADKEVISKLESELATAKSKTASGGPKRAVINKPVSSNVNELVLKAMEYRNKSAATLDPVLAKGYKEIAIDFEKEYQALLNK